MLPHSHYICPTLTTDGMGETLKSKTAQGLIWGVIGNGGMQVASLVFGIFLSRLLSPSDYGMVGVLTVFSAVAGIFIEAGFITAIVNKREVTDDDYNAVFWFSLIMGMVLFGVLFAAAPWIAAFFGHDELVALSRVLFTSIIFSCLGTSAAAYYLRNLRVRQRSIIQLVAIVVAGTAGVVMAWLGCGYWGIAAQTILYIALSTAGMWLLCPWRPSWRIDLRPLRPMLSFSTRQLATALFNQVNNNIFSFLLGRFYAIDKVGYYTQGNKWTVMGTLTLQGMLNSTAQPVMRQARDDKARLVKVFRKMTRFTAFLSFPLMLGLGVVSEELIVIAVTDKWLPAAPVMHILCVGGAFMPLATLFSGLMNSIGRPNIYMWNTIALGIAQLCCLVFSFRLGLEAMLTAYVTINIAWLAVWWWFARRHIGLTAAAFLADLLPYLAAAAVSVYGAAWAAHGITNVYASLAAKIAIAVAAYVVIMRLSGSVMFKESVDYIIKKKRDI